MPGKATLTEVLRAGRARGTTRIALVAAHPDDETVGAGGHLPTMPRVTLVYLTDGAPRDGRDAKERGFSTAAEYAKARRRELEQALAIAGVTPGQCVHLGVADQESAFHLADLALELAHFFSAGRPDWVLTHSYEGGHPDHDAAAFAVHAAAALVRNRGSEPPAIIEFASYHARNGALEAGSFLPPPGGDASGLEFAAWELSEEQRRV
ncbi:MAG: PIG-L family deacetylase, partial [Deltaproteobacteria bacterium]|nr:PIG-L family deacetylase [Deltaproteobacteria bacterium]